MTFADDVKKEITELARLNVRGAQKALQSLDRDDVVESINNDYYGMTVRECADLIIDLHG